jgi:glycosyltransferase involved in cell wall biosynthesis
MRIALYNLTTTTKLGGVESFVWEIGRCLSARGHAVTLFGGHGTLARTYPDLTVRQYPYIPREVWGRNPVLRKSLNLLKLLERLSMARHALNDLSAGRYQIVQLSKPYDFPVAALAKRRQPTTVIYNSQGTDFFPGDVLFRRTIDGAFSCSRYNASMVEQRYLFPISVSFNGFDQQTFRPLPPDPVLRARLAPDGAPLIFYVGRLMTFKGIDYLIDAMTQLGSIHSTAQPTYKQNGAAKRLARPPRLIIAGDGPHRAGLEQRARERGVADRVHFLGPINNRDLPHYHAVSDLFVLPSTDHETFGIAACEAMACERPVVGANTGGIPEVVIDGETGFLVPPADAAALADRIGRLLTDPHLRQRFGAAGRERVLAEFTWDRVVERVLACYHQSSQHTTVY